LKSASAASARNALLSERGRRNLPEHCKSEKFSYRKYKGSPFSLRKVAEYEGRAEGREIDPGLFLGGQVVAGNRKWLTEVGVRFILNVTSEVHNFFEDDKELPIEYENIAISDSMDSKLR
jgi:hypothetical protein